MNIKKYFHLLLVLLLPGCSSSQYVQSSFSNNIVVDGVYNDWGTNLNFIEDKNIGFGFVNNNDFLYVSLVTSDKNSIRKIVMNGLTLWIESSEGKIGVKYPFKTDPSESIRMRIPQQDNREMSEMLKGREDLQVINENELPLYTFRADAGEEFRAKINIDNQNLVYELQIPVKNNEITERVFAHNIKKAELTFETGEINREDMRVGRPRSGMGERGAIGGGRRGGGMRPQREPVDFSPLEYSFEVELNQQQSIQ